VFMLLRGVGGGGGAATFIQI